MKQNKHSKRKKIGIALIIGLLIVIGGSFLLLKFITYQPSAEAHEASQTENVVETSAWLKFNAQGTSKNLAVIFYQGALVSEEAYSLWAGDLAQAGYDVYILTSPAALAISQPNLAEKVLAENPTTEFVIGGHSLGGVVGSRFAKTQLANPHLKGVFFLASYPDEKGSLAETDLPVLSVTGDLDGVLNQESYAEGKAYLPTDTEYEVLAGGNHAGFGSYGEQKGDRVAQLTNQEQQRAVAESLTRWLDELPR